MINRAKITDGDLIIVTLGGENWSHASTDKLRDHVQKWLDSRGLGECKLLAAHTEAQKEALCINILSANDVFDNTVLKDQ